MHSRGIWGKHSGIKAPPLNLTLSNSRFWDDKMTNSLQQIHWWICHCVSYSFHQINLYAMPFGFAFSTWTCTSEDQSHRNGVGNILPEYQVFFFFWRSTLQPTHSKTTTTTWDIPFVTFLQNAVKCFDASSIKKPTWFIHTGWSWEETDTLKIKAVLKVIICKFSKTNRPMLCP